MTREELRGAIAKGIPFIIKMADGARHKVADPDRIALGRSYAMVVGDDDLAHLLPLPKMTAISYRKGK